MGFPDSKKGKKVAPKVVASGKACDSGNQDAELSKASGSMYSGAVKNRGGGDQAVKSR